MLHRLFFGAALLLVLAPPALALSDLTGSVEVEMDYGPADALVTFHVTLENIGDAYCDASIYWADFWGAYPCQCDTNPLFCGTAPASDKTWEITDPAVLGPGAVWSPEDPLMLTLPYSDEPYRFMLFVDSIFSCNEGGSEENNLVCGEFTISPESQNPDLEITDCTVDQDPDYPAGVLFTAKVRNVGDSETPYGTYVDFFMQANPDDQSVDVVWGVDEPDDFFPVDEGLAPQQEITVESTLTSCEADWYYPIFTVNGLETFGETNFENNWCVPTPPLYECTENVFLPDLTISEVSVDQEILDAQGLILIRGKIKNKGLVPIQAENQYKLCIYEDWPQKPEDCEVPEHGVNGWIVPFANGLGPALEQEFDKVSETALSGLHNYWFRVDCDCVDPEHGEILESDEKNNDATLNDVLIPVDGPDLMISSFQAAVLSIDGVNVIRYIVEVTNIGNKTIGKDIDVDLFRSYTSEVPPTLESVLAAMEAEEEWPQNAEYFSIIGGLGANGDHVQAEFTDWAPMEAGTYTPWVVVDIVDGINEANESNNTATIVGGVEYEPVPPTDGPNLDIETFTAKIAGNRVTYDLVVRNTGDEVAEGPFRIDLFTDRESPPNLFQWSDLNITVGELIPDEIASWTYEWEDVPDGVYRSYALADTDNVIWETEEGDNLAGFLLIEIGATLCPEGKIINDGCLCSGEPQFTGYCCEGEWSAAPCFQEHPDQVEMAETDVVSVDTVAPPPPGFGSTGGDCGCRHAPPVGAPGGPLLVISLLGALVLVLRRREC